MELSCQSATIPIIRPLIRSNEAIWSWSFIFMLISRLPIGNFIAQYHNIVTTKSKAEAKDKEIKASGKVEGEKEAINFLQSKPGGFWSLVSEISLSLSLSKDMTIRDPTRKSITDSDGEN